ncbi:MAG: hypothetical protein Q9216_003675 [Gyalolechia sp. 2 TL-2023]
MEEAASQSYFKSKVFEIVVGPSAESFYAHADALAKSVVLRETVQGPWRENLESKLEWPDWEATIVSKFLERLYTNDYKCPGPVKVCETMPTLLSSAEAKGKSSAESPVPEDDHVIQAAVDEPPPVPAAYPLDDGYKFMPMFGMPRPESPDKEGTSARSTIRPLTRIEDLTWHGCRNLKRSSAAAEFDWWMGHQPRQSDKLDYEITLMTHAKLYVMACFYQLDALQDMSWERLKAVLVSVGKPGPRTPIIGNLVALIHDVYQETGQNNQAEEPLRMLVTSFAAIHCTNFIGTAVHDLLLLTEETDREFVVDLFEKLAQQMKYLATQTPPSPMDYPRTKKGQKEHGVGLLILSLTPRHK